MSYMDAKDKMKKNSILLNVYRHDMKILLMFQQNKTKLKREHFSSTKLF